MHRVIGILMVFIGIFCLSPSLPAQADLLFSAEKEGPDGGSGLYSQFVLNAILKDIGLKLDDSKKGAPDREKKSSPQKKSDRKPAPDQQKKADKKKTDQDDGWGDDDDFFSDDDDFDSMSFDDAVADFDKEFQETVDAWDKEYEETVARWNKAKKKYNKEKDKYEAATYNMALYSPTKAQLSSVAVSPTQVDKMDIDRYKPGDYHVIPYALDLDIRNQDSRGTCAAFAGIHTIEILLNRYRDTYKEMKNIDLSEQHFFWLSKPKCRQTACSNDGSNFDVGFIKSNEDTPESLIRLEMVCPYNPFPNDTNVTYMPLTKCITQKGLFKVTKFHRELQLNQLVNELAANRPVAAGLKLPKSFFSAKGFIRLNDPESMKKGSGKHAAGHAVTFVGFIKLPEHYWADEGKYCVITTNSWGVGWGVGGHACVSEKWIEKHLIDGFLTSVEEVKLINK